MASVTDSNEYQMIERGNARLAALLHNVRRCLNGEGTFGTHEIAALARLLAEMEPVVARSAELKRTKPEMNAALDCYRSQLLELGTAMEKLQVILLAQRTNLESRHARVDAASRWCDGFRQTR